MKVVYVKYIDPMLWTKPEDKLYDEDVDLLDLMVVREAGILVREDEKKIILAEVHIGEDNPSLVEWEIVFPFYRHVSVINKQDILHREDFEIQGSLSSETK